MNNSILYSFVAWFMAAKIYFCINQFNWIGLDKEKLKWMSFLHASMTIRMIDAYHGSINPKTHKQMEWDGASIHIEPQGE